MDVKNEKKVEKVITGEVKQKKSIARSFLAEDLSSVGTYILTDVIVPNVKKALFDTVSNGFEMLLWGEVKSNKPTNSLGSRISYNKMYEAKSALPKPDRKLDYTGLIFDTKSEAEMVLSTLTDIIDRYDVCSVAELYEAIGRPNDIEHTDNKYGWNNLGSAEVIRSRDGYWLKLPKAMPI